MELMDCKTNEVVGTATPAQALEALRGNALSVDGRAVYVRDFEGLRVVAGIGADRDTGRVAGLPDSAGLVLVAWDSGVCTPCHVDDLCVGAGQ